MGTGGYKCAVSKWEQSEAALIAKGVTPATAHWLERSKHWFYGHGGSLDPLTGEINVKEQIKTASDDLVKAIDDVRKGTF